MRDDNKWLDSGIEYAERLKGQEDLSPNEHRIIALADEVTRLRAELKRAQGVARRATR